MQYIFSFIIIILLFGCENKALQDIEKYTYFDSMNQSYTIELNQKIIKLIENSKQVHKPILFMFLGFDCRNCKMYYDHLNNLATSYTKIKIIGILQDKTNQSELKDFIQENQIDFEIIAPKHNVNILEIISNNKAIELKNDFSQSKISEDNFSDTHQNNTVKIPYFILSNVNGEIYQEYEGIIPEEIFSKDILQMLR